MAEPLAGGDLPVRVLESGWARSGRWSGHSTRWRAPLETPAPSWPIPGHRSSGRPTRPGASSGTTTIHSPKGQGTTVRVELLGRVPREPAYRLQWSSRPVVTAEIPLCAPHSGLVSRCDSVGCLLTAKHHTSAFVRKPKTRCHRPSSCTQLLQFAAASALIQISQECRKWP
jgi:hypothetical protein